MRDTDLLIIFNQGRGGTALTEEEKGMIETDDFDFEANLAMFDKDQVMQEIDADLMANKPDVVRLVHTNVRRPEPKFQHDENVLGEQSEDLDPELDHILPTATKIGMCYLSSEIIN